MEIEGTADSREVEWEGDDDGNTTCSTAASEKFQIEAPGDIFCAVGAAGFTFWHDHASETPLLHRLTLSFQ